MKLSYKTAITHPDDDPLRLDKDVIKGPSNLPEAVKYPNIPMIQNKDRSWEMTCPHCNGHGCKDCNWQGSSNSLNNPPVMGNGYEEPYNAYDILNNIVNRPIEEGLITDYYDFGPKRQGSWQIDSVNLPFLNVNGKSFEWDKNKEEWVLHSLNDWEMGPIQPDESMGEERYHNHGLQISDEKPDIQTIGA